MNPEQTAGKAEPASGLVVPVLRCSLLPLFLHLIFSTCRFGVAQRSSRVKFGTLSRTSVTFCECLAGDVYIHAKLAEAANDVTQGLVSVV